MFHVVFPPIFIIGSLVVYEFSDCPSSSNGLFKSKFMLLMSWYNLSTSRILVSNRWFDIIFCSTSLAFETPESMVSRNFFRVQSQIWGRRLMHLFSLKWPQFFFSILFYFWAIWRLLFESELHLTISRMFLNSPYVWNIA